MPIDLYSLLQADRRSLPLLQNLTHEFGEGKTFRPQKSRKSKSRDTYIVVAIDKTNLAADRQAGEAGDGREEQYVIHQHDKKRSRKAVMG